MKKPLSVIATALFLAACNANKPAEQQQGFTSFPQTDLYDAVAAEKFAALHVVQADSANKVFMLAVDKYRNGKDPKAAVAVFEQSLSVLPTAKAYYELGNALSELGSFDKALKSYKVAERLGFEPLSKLLYNTACAHSLNGDTSAAISYLEYAMEAGYSNAAQIMKDPDLAAARSDEYAFQAAFRSAMTGAADAEAAQFATFKRGFPVIVLPVVLNKETIPPTDRQEDYINYDYELYIPEMRTEKFSRDVSKEFFYYANLTQGDDYSVLVYVVRNAIMGEEAPFAYVMASFTNKGRLIDKMVIAGKEEPQEAYRICRIQPNLGLEIKLYEEQYEKDPEEEGYYDNKVTAMKLTSTEQYRIGDDGHFIKSGRLVGMVVN